MTLSAKPSAAQRRWLAAITAVGILLTGVALATEWKPRGVYWSRVTVEFHVPNSAANGNVIKLRSSNLVRTAGLVARIVDPSGGKLRLADDDVTLASEGIVHGTAVTLPNSGGQWSYSFGEPRLQVEAVGTTPEEVQRRMTDATEGIRRALAGLQPSSRVYESNMITVLQTPSGGPPLYFQSANRSRALASTVLLGLLLTLAARAGFRASAARRATRVPSGGDARSRTSAAVLASAESG